MALYGARRGSQGMPQSMVGFFSANPIVVAAANIGALAGVAALLWQGGKRVMRIGRFVHRNSVSSLIDWGREDRQNLANAFAVDAVYLLAYQHIQLIKILVNLFGAAGSAVAFVAAGGEWFASSVSVRLAAFSQLVYLVSGITFCIRAAYVARTSYQISEAVALKRRAEQFDENGWPKR